MKEPLRDAPFSEEGIRAPHTRPPRIPTFGHGVHACIGKPFAKIEGKLCLEKLLAFAPGSEVQEAKLERIRTQFVPGWESMPVVFGR